MERETKVGLRWVAAVSVAIVLAFVIEAAASQLSPFAVRWPIEEQGSFLAQGSVAVGESFVYPLDVSVLNVTAIRAALEWTDDVGAADRFEVSFRGPRGQEGEPTAGDTGSLVAAMPVAQTPRAEDLRASDERALRRGAAMSYASSDALGLWVVDVRLVEAPGLGVPGAPAELQPDGQNAFSLRVTLDVYRLEISERL